MRVVALVPAYDSEGSIAATVVGLLATGRVDRIVVIDDGSNDDTAGVAATAGASVVRIEPNGGKGGALTAGVAASPDADVYLLVDADTGESAAAAAGLLDEVLAGTADLVIGRLPGAGGRGGFGVVRDVAAAGIRRACGLTVTAPLSGQRAVTADVLRQVTFAPRFGVETAMTIDAVRLGARVVEQPVEMEHRHTGRSLAGFSHRGRQGLDILGALWPRLTSRSARLGLVALVTVAVIVGMSAISGRWEPAAQPLAEPVDKVVIFGTPHLSFDDLREGPVPELRRLAERGSVGALSVRTASARPSTAEAYASLGAGVRVRAPAALVGLALGSDDAYEGDRAGDTAARRTGRRSTGDIVVPGIAQAVRANEDRFLSSEIGALGQALHDAGRETAVVGNADRPADPASPVDPVLSRPGAVALVDQAGAVDAGDISADLLRRDPSAPFGIRADPTKVLTGVRRALDRADVVLIDPGDLDRASVFVGQASEDAGRLAWNRALARTDRMLARVVDALPPRTLLIVMTPSPPTGGGWHLTPAVVVGSGRPAGYLHSPSVRRARVVTITDLAPTVLAALGEPVATGMIGQPLTYQPADASLDGLSRLDRNAAYREGIYFQIALTYIIVQAVLYVIVLAALPGLSRRPGSPDVRAVRAAVVACAAFPLATFVFRAVPGVSSLGYFGIGILLLVEAVISWLALRARTPLGPLSRVAWWTIVLIVADLATGARLQEGSILGYSLHTAARFYGIGNTAFASLIACACLVAALGVARAQRPDEAWWTAAAVLAVVVVADGSPAVGNDVGGILTMIPVFGLLLLALRGWRLDWRRLLLVGVVTALALAVATGIDLLRPPEVRTHLGRLASSMVSGSDDAFGLTVARKLATNLRVLSTSIWTWMVPVVAVFMLFLPRVEQRTGGLLPVGSPLRAGMRAMLFAGLLGWAVNDSGVVVTAIVFIYVGPLLTLLALDRPSVTVDALEVP